MTLSLSVILGIVILALIAKWELSKVAAIVCILFGITIGGTEAGNTVMGWVDQFGNIISQIKF